jgi:hypothetical protein
MKSERGDESTMTNKEIKQGALRVAIDITKLYAGSTNPQKEIDVVLESTYRKLLKLFIEIQSAK